MATLGEIMGCTDNQDTVFDASVPHLIRFDVDANGSVSSMINNKKVYRDKSSEQEISAGDCWLCSLSYNVKGNNYFAKGLRLMDAEDIIRDNKDLVGELAEYMLDYAPAIVANVCMPSMEAKVEEMVDARSKEMVDAMEEAHASELDALNQVIKDRDATIEGLNDALEGMGAEYERIESELAERDATIEGLNAALEALRRQVKELESSPAIVRDVPRIPTFADEAAPEGVVRLSKDELCSRLFKDGSYRVRFSINGRRMTITEDPEGETQCSNNIIRIPNLEALLPFDGEGMMIHKEMADGMTVSLL